MINKDIIQNIRIKRLRFILPLIALVIIFLIIFQSINIATTKNDKNLNIILSDPIFWSRQLLDLECQEGSKAVESPFGVLRHVYSIASK